MVRAAVFVGEGKELVEEFDSFWRIVAFGDHFLGMFEPVKHVVLFKPMFGGASVIGLHKGHQLLILQKPSFILGHNSPQIFFDVGFELGLLGPAGGLEEGADVLLFGGRERTSAVMVLVVALATIAMDKAGLDAALHPAWDVVIDGLDANSHADGLVVAIHETLFGLSVWLGEIDTQGNEAILWHVGTDKGPEAMLSQRTTDRKAGYISLRLLAKDLLTSGTGNSIIFAHIVMCCYSNFDAKIVIICETTKHFATKYIKKRQNYT